MPSPESQQTLELSPVQTESFRLASIEILKDITRERSYPGYPQFEQRLQGRWLGSDLFNNPVIHKGPWWVNDGDYYDEDIMRPYKGVTEFDSHSRPLHPWFWDMVQNPDIGVVAGKGVYWNWGPNYTADPIIIRRDLDEPHVLLIKREDTGAWALPGGFVNDGESGFDAAAREALEEANIDLGQLEYESKTIYQGPVADIRTTAHAWAETTAVCFELSDESAAQFTEMEYEGTDDATEAKWTPVSELDTQLFGSHLLLIAIALQK